MQLDAQRPFLRCVVLLRHLDNVADGDAPDRRRVSDEAGLLCRIGAPSLQTRPGLLKGNPAADDTVRCLLGRRCVRRIPERLERRVDSAGSMRHAMETMQATTEAAREAGRDLPAADRIRAYVSVFAERLIGVHHETWIHQLMLREMSDPTPALAMVAAEVLKPRIVYLSSAIAELLHCAPDDPRVLRCALSVTSQFNSLLWTKGVAKLLDAEDGVPGSIDEIAEHIAQFSLGGMSGVKSR